MALSIKTYPEKFYFHNRKVMEQMAEVVVRYIKAPNNIFNLFRSVPPMWRLINEAIEDDQ